MASSPIFPHGYDTEVGERDAPLRRRASAVSLARAFLKDAPVLILDEPTSAVDFAAEAAIIDAMGRLAEERTTLLITHRLMCSCAVSGCFAWTRATSSRGGVPPAPARGGLGARWTRREPHPRIRPGSCHALADRRMGRLPASIQCSHRRAVPSSARDIPSHASKAPVNPGCASVTAFALTTERPSASRPKGAWKWGTARSSPESYSCARRGSLSASAWSLPTT